MYMWLGGWGYVSAILIALASIYLIHDLTGYLTIEVIFQVSRYELIFRFIRNSFICNLK